MEDRQGELDPGVATLETELVLSDSGVVTMETELDPSDSGVVTMEAVADINTCPGPEQVRQTAFGSVRLR